MRRLALIPGRGGSKGVPEKNIAPINGESLARRAARCAVECGIFDRIVVTSDDERIAREAQAGGAEWLFNRPVQLSTDDSPVYLTIQHAWRFLAERGDEADLIVLLEPTSPFRTPEIVRRLVDLVEARKADSGQTLSLVPDRYRPVKQMVFGGDEQTHHVAVMPDGIYNRQDLPKTYIRNGMAYVMSRCCVIDLGKVYGPRNVGIVVEGPAINIDWPEDLDQARAILERGPDR